mmetsp:Transcript_2646/g.3562  ORF Transcript_2646/g.3562 Transcript_2646/m.3562 type:complete len:563 (-) Transcript_2646:1828-3516(-)
MLHKLPLDLAALCASYCSGNDLTRLVCTCKDVNKQLTRNMQVDEYLWKPLYLKHKFGTGKRPRPPSFPSAGSWREVYIRAVAAKVFLVIRSLSKTHKKDYRIVVSRDMSLFALKKEIRALQLHHDGVALEDFELIDAKSGTALGLQGNDSLPPSDLGFLFVSRESLIRSRSATRVIERLLRSEARPAWRRTLFLVEDGAELCQVFVKKRENGILAMQRQIPRQRQEQEQEQTESAAEFLESMADGNIDYLVKLLTDDTDVDMNSIDVFSELDHILRQTQEQVGYNAHKMFWNGVFNPMIHVALSKKSSLPLFVRLSALTSLVQMYVRELFRGRFYLDILIRATIGSGFFMTFSRLLRRLMPLLIRTQVKQIIDAEIDWIPLFFAVRFALKVSFLALESVVPVALISFCYQLLRHAIRTVLNYESKWDDVLVCAALVALEQTFFLRKQIARIPKVSTKASKLLSLKALIDFLKNFFKTILRLRLRRFKDCIHFAQNVIDRAKNRKTVQFALSSLFFSLVGRVVDPSLFITLPVYAYALPFFFTMLLVRIRMSISDSYYCVLYL